MEKAEGKGGGQSQVLMAKADGMYLTYCAIDHLRFLTELQVFTYRLE